MEFLSEIIDSIKTGKRFETVLTELIDVIKLFLRKNQRVRSKEFKKLIKRIGGAVRVECPNAFPILNFLTRLLTSIKKCQAEHDHTEKPYQHKRLLRMLSENIKLKPIGSETDIGPDSNILEIMGELNEYDNITDEISTVAKMHIQNDETILVYGNSDLMKEFVTSAIEEYNVSIVVVRNSMCENLAFGSELKNVVYITENSVGAIINKVSKVFIDCLSVMADGAVINSSGSFNVVLLAKEYSIPVIVLAPLHHFTPLYAFSQHSFNEFLRPQTQFSRAYSSKNLEVQIVKYDLIPSDYITLVVTQYGEFAISYVYRAFSEYYGEIEYGYEF